MGFAVQLKHNPDPSARDYVSLVLDGMVIASVVVSVPVVFVRLVFLLVLSPSFLCVFNFLSLGNVIATRADWQHNRNYDDFETFAEEMAQTAKTVRDTNAAK
jgi:hypothetical protein